MLSAVCDAGYEKILVQLPDLWYNKGRNGIPIPKHRKGSFRNTEVTVSTMCGRYTTEVETEEREMYRILARAADNELGLLRPQSAAEVSVGDICGREVFPSEAAAALIPNSAGAVDAFFCTWGFPSDIGGKHRLVINACSETVLQRPMFASAFASRRCIIPTAGFFEWSHTGRRADSERKYRFNLPHTGLLYLAGLYRETVCDDGTAARAFVILTRDASDSMRPIHHRMPVIVRQEHIEDYLGDSKEAVRLLSEIPPVLLKKLVS